MIISTNSKLKDMTDNLHFYMDGPARKMFIDEHKFYMEHVCKRLLSQFENIQREVEEFTEQLLAKKQQFFDPENDNIYDYYDQVDETSTDFCIMLTNTYNCARLSLIAGIFQEWDKNVRDWLTREIINWNTDKSVRDEVWGANFYEITDLLESMDRDIKKQKYFKSLDKYRCLTNVFKHGVGQSFTELKKRYPEFCEEIKDQPEIFFIYKEITVTNEHVEECSDAIIDFWEAVPERAFPRDMTNVPKWFIESLNHK